VQHSIRQNQDRLVFISYASEPDEAAALRFVCELEREGVTCWIACRDVRPGDNYAAAIIAAIKNCRVTVLLMSSASNGSQHVANEIERAVNYRKEIIPVRLERVLPSSAVELHLSTRQWIDLFEPRQREANMRRLLDDLRDRLRQWLGPGLSPSAAPAEADNGGRVAADSVEPSLTQSAASQLGSPEDAQTLYDVGCTYMARGDLERAVVEFSSALAISSSITGAYCNRGSAYWRLSRFDEAIADFNEALKIDLPTKAAVPIFAMRGSSFLAKQRYSEAIADLTKALELGNPLAQIFMERGIAYQWIGANERALADYNSAVEVDPDFPHLATCYFNRANMLRTLGRCADAMADFSRATELDAGFAEKVPPHYKDRNLQFASQVDEALRTYSCVTQIAVASQLPPLQRAKAYRAMQNIGWKKAFEDLELLDRALPSNDSIRPKLNALLVSLQKQRAQGSI
jgi:tetratricopeptide (TPR) repeat protein